MGTQEPLLDMRNISKSFGAVQALQNVDFQVYPGELVGLVGDNGAGKSTLVKIISGVLKPDDGQIFFEGGEVSIDSPDDAKQIGIETLYQTLGLIDNLDIAANMYLGREEYTSLFFGLIKVLKNKKMEVESADMMQRLKVNMSSVREKVDVLSGGQRQAIALSRAIGWGQKLVLLDEPTAALGVRESKQALELIQSIREHGTSGVLISHNMEHVFSVVDRIVVLRQGVMRGTRKIDETTGDEIVSMITGSDQIAKARV